MKPAWRRLTACIKSGRQGGWGLRTFHLSNCILAFAMALREEPEVEQRARVSLGWRSDLGGLLDMQPSCAVLCSAT